MADDTHTSSPAPSTAPSSGTEVYDMLMAQIEPELLSANIPHLEELHAGETEEQRAQRFERYTQAFAQYDKMYAAWQVSFEAQVGENRRAALRSAEQRSREEEAGMLTQIESELESSLSAA